VANYSLARHTGPFVALGALVAVACLASTLYINRLQSELTSTVRQEAAGLNAAVELQVQMRHLRVHSLAYVADPTPARRAVLNADLASVDRAFDELRAASPEDAALVEKLTRDYREYQNRLDFEHLPRRPGVMADVAAWSDAHQMADLLVPCRELADRQRNRMTAGLAQSESQTAWAGRVLLVLGVVGALGGLLSGYATARGLNRRVARLLVHVRAVHAHLDQDVGTMTVEGPAELEELDEQLDRVVGRVREVCERLQQQERTLIRTEQLAAVGQLAASVAHEVRNPLTGVKLLMQAAARPESPIPLTPERLALLMQEIARIERTIQGLMDLAAFPAPDRRPNDLRAIVEDAVDASRAKAEAKPVSLRFDSPEHPVPAAVDKDQMHSLFTNLISNAVDAARSSVLVALREHGGRVEVEVSDDGPGIDSALTGRLFTPFATTKAGGTGLGLTIARRIAVDHGGTLDAANRPDGGAAFTLVLPEDHDAEAARRG
jgi:signal transduction histidine kinase